MNIKKLKKLMKNPKLFFMDSFLIRKIILRNARKKFQINSNCQKKGIPVKQKESNINLISKKSLLPRNGFSIISFFNKIYEKVPCFMIKYEIKRSVLCIRDGEYINFLRRIAELSCIDNLILAYNINNRLTRPSTYTDLLDDLSDKKIIDFKISDRRSRESIYFTVEVWRTIDNYILAPRANMISRKIFLDEFKERNFFKKNIIPDICDIQNCRHDDIVDFEIDYVFTWVNSEDEEWQKMYSCYKPNVNNDGNNLSRFKNREELKYALRSLELNAPWLRKIFIVSNCNPPSWLNINNKKIEFVRHESIFDMKNLPTFSSHAIETCLHKIPGLMNYFIYSNDDFFLARQTTKTHWQ